MFRYLPSAWEVGEVCELRPTVRFVALAVADRLNREGVCWVSQRTLAGMTGLSIRTVGRALKELEDVHGVIGRTRRAAIDGSGRTTDLIAWRVPVRAGTRSEHHMAEVEPLPTAVAA